MKAPKVSEREWFAIKGDTLNPERPWGICQYLTLEECQEIDGNEATFPSRTVVLAEVTSGETSEADAKMLAASKKMAEALESIRVDALRYMDDPKRQTSALWDIEATAKDALLSAGYTEGDE